MTNRRKKELEDDLVAIATRLEKICEELKLTVHVDGTYYTKYNETDSTIFVHYPNNGGCVMRTGQKNIIGILFEKPKKEETENE